jgi:hypothetical protein
MEVLHRDLIPVFLFERRKVMDYFICLIIGFILGVFTYAAPKENWKNRPRNTGPKEKPKYKPTREAPNPPPLNKNQFIQIRKLLKSGGKLT